MHKIVHLDFKGAPLKVPYLEKVLRCIKIWGGTGVLLEWEDTFPYSGDLAVIGSVGGCGGDGMYTMDEVKHILKFMKDIGLEAIQLVQTIGHMEFVLKHPAFRDLREVPNTPAVLCPSKPESVALVKAMLQQALDVQPDAKHFHIGADEVWHTAACKQCQDRAISSKYRAPALFLEHIKEIASFLKEQRPDMTILMWDDMLRSISIEALEYYKIDDLIQPVVWNYNVREHFKIDLWDIYKKIFPNVWVGSAFKGANGSCQVLSSVTHYVSNQDAWIKEVKCNCYKITFIGVILTGWSRYDHYSTLCELLPVALPSLSCCLTYWRGFDHPREDLQISEVLDTKEWPGVELARCIHSFVMLRDRSHNLIHGDLIPTWLNPWQVERSYTSPAQVQGIAATAYSLVTDLKGLQEELQAKFDNVTGKRSSEEWIASFFTPLYNKINEIHDIATKRLHFDASIRPY